MELCDYTLDEYVNIVRLDHQQDPLSANRLAWQLLKGLKYLHSNFAVPHGNLMVSSIDYGYQNVRVRKLVGRKRILFTCFISEQRFVKKCNTTLIMIVNKDF